MGMGGVGSIPRTIISDYIATEGITADTVFRRMIRAMDAVYLRTVRENMDK